MRLMLKLTRQGKTRVINKVRIVIRGTAPKPVLRLRVAISPSLTLPRGRVGGWLPVSSGTLLI